MKHKKLLSIIGIAVLGIFIWRHFHVPSPSISVADEGASSSVKAPEQATEDSAGGEAEEKSESDATAESKESDKSSRRGGSRSGDMRDEMRRRWGGRRGERSSWRRDPNQPRQEDDGTEPEPMESVNLNNLEMRLILQKLGEWTGKPIIPVSDDVMKQRITIYSSEKLPRSKALLLVYDALRARGIVAEEVENKIFLKPISQAKLGAVPTIGADEALARIQNKSQVVEKFFKLKSYSASGMAEIVTPLTAEYGHVTAIEGTGDLIVIDTVENLLRIERIIRQIDVPESDLVVEEIFEIKHGDPSEIVQVLELILASGERSSRDTRNRGRRRSTPQPQPKKESKPKSGGGAKAASSIVIAPTEIPIKLIPIPKQNWIIARASAEDMENIAEWISQLDRTETVSPEQSVVFVSYVDADDVADIIKAMLSDMPGTELRASVVVEAMPASKQVVIFGSEENRKMIEKMIADIDLPMDEVFDEKTFKLKHADPDQIKENIDQLFGESVPRFDSYSYYRYGAGSRRKPEDVVKVISYPTLKQVTVIASFDNMIKISRQITEQWDLPIDIESDQYRILTLYNSDPVQMVDLLSTLFSEESSSSSRGRDFMRMIFGGRGGGDEKKKIVGSLYGILTFEPVPDTKKIIVISKIPEAYDVIEKLVRELDDREKAEVPKVITLKYADAEDLCEQLNAMLNEPGTTATLRRSGRGLSEYDSESGSSGAGQEEQSSGTITPWWNRQRSNRDEEMPTSNLIGKIRFIPVHRSKAILVLAPPEYIEDIERLVASLDKPGMQVMIKVVIVEVDHSKMTSLGVQLSSDPLGTAFGTLGENALTTLSKLSNFETHGSLTIDSKFNINVLIDLLVKNLDARVLNQPTLWTKDNKEAIFIKGKEIALLNSAQSDSTGLSITTAYDYRDVGVTLRIRPNITPEKAVDMTINLEISEISTDEVNGQVVINKLDTTTSLIVNDGQTILLGGILFQNDSLVERKIPLLGDIPIIGGLFRHEETVRRNNELLAFVTPYVIDANSLEAIPAQQDTFQEVERTRRKMEDVVGQLNEIFMADDYAAEQPDNKAITDEQ
jgi:general secretion pathway protein D